jgi:hypothetical protein
MIVRRRLRVAHRSRDEERLTRRGGGPGESSTAAAAATGIRLPSDCHRRMPDLSSGSTFVILVPIGATMVVHWLPDRDGLATELADLRRRQRDLLRQHDRLTERMLALPNEFGLAWARSLAAEIESMGSRIDELESARS